VPSIRAAAAAGLLRLQATSTEDNGQGTTLQPNSHPKTKDFKCKILLQTPGCGYETSQRALLITIFVASFNRHVSAPAFCAILPPVAMSWLLVVVEARAAWQAGGWAHRRAAGLTISPPYLLFLTSLRLASCPGLHGQAVQSPAPKAMGKLCEGAGQTLRRSFFGCS
jgi:hypothetical protein